MSVEDISGKFTIKTIPAVIGLPTYKAINEVLEALYANAAAIPTTLGGGRNGHIALIMDAAVSANVSTMAYIIPMDPGPYAQPGPGNSAAARADANVIHKEGRRIYDLDENLDATLKQEIIAAVEETNLSAKNKRYMGFHGVSSKKLMDHLMERYGKIRTPDLESCRQTLAAPIQVDRPIDVYFQRVEDAIQFA